MVAALPFVPVIKQRSGLTKSSMGLANEVKRFMITWGGFLPIRAMLV
jgi:hypothetical protein